MDRRGVNHVRGRVRCPAVSGKIERFFRTLRLWLRWALLPEASRPMQRRLDGFAHWYNCCRPHAALGGRTPDEVWTGEKPPAPIPFYAADRRNLTIRMRRTACRGDPRLPIIHIQIEQRRAAA